MSNPNTPAPDTRVIHAATGVYGTLTSTNGISAVVQWDAAGVAMPHDILPVTDLMWSGDDHLEPVSDIRNVSDAALEAEISRRGLEERARNLETAVGILRANPELATQKVSVAQLAQAADNAGIPWASTAEAWTVLRELGELAGK